MNRRERRELKRRGAKSVAPRRANGAEGQAGQTISAIPDPVGNPQSAVNRKVMMELTAFAGPIPPPALLAEYEQACPGSAERILTQFEEQGRHRRRLENRVVWYNVVSGVLGQVAGFVLFLTAIGGGIFLLYNDKPVEGLGSIVTAIAGAAWVLRKAEVARQAELAAKRDQEKRR